MQRKNKVAALGASTIAFWVLWLIDQIARAQTVYDLIPAVAGVKINWAPIYLTGAIASTAFLIAANWDWLSAWSRRRQRANHHEWNLSLQDGAGYVAFGSCFGEAMAEADQERRAIRSLIAIWEAARAGKVVLGGSDLQSVTPQPLRKKVLQGLTLKYRSVNPHSHVYGYAHVYDIRLVRSDNEAEVVYSRLFVEQQELWKMWPPRR